MARLVAAVIAAVALFVAVAPVSADPIDDYRRNGTIDPCKYSDGQLRKGRGNLPPDVEQYAPGLADALNQGREGCGSGGAPGSSDPRQSEVVPAPASTGSGGSGGGGPAAPKARKAQVLAPPSPTVDARRRLADISTPAVATQVDQDPPGWIAPLLLGLLAVAALVALLRLVGVDTDRFTRPLRASFGDAGGRSADAAAELWDRLRLGR